jgi:hypothetical protein
MLRTEFQTKRQEVTEEWGGGGELHSKNIKILKI